MSNSSLHSSPINRITMLSKISPSPSLVKLHNKTASFYLPGSKKVNTDRPLNFKWKHSVHSMSEEEPIKLNEIFDQTLMENSKLPKIVKLKRFTRATSKPQFEIGIDCSSYKHRLKQDEKPKLKPKLLSSKLHKSRKMIYKSPQDIIKNIIKKYHVLHII